MKKRILSMTLVLCMLLALLPAASVPAFAAVNSYGPDGDGYGYVTSEKYIDLGEIEYSGTEKKNCGSFTVTIENTGTETLHCLDSKGGGNGLYYHQPEISLAPGEKTDVTIRYDVPKNREYGEYEDYWYIRFEGTPVDSMIQFITNFTLVEPKQSSSSSGSSGSNGVFNGTDNMGNRYHGVQVGGSSGGNTIVVGGSGSTVDLGDISIEEGEKYGFTVSPHHLSFDTCFEGETVDPLYVTLTNTGTTSMDYRYDAYLKDRSGGYRINKRRVKGELNSKGELDPGASLTYELTLNTYQAGSGTVSYEGEFVLFSHTEYSFGSGGFGVGKGGTGGYVPDVLTVDYNVLPLSEVAAGDIAWKISDKSLDFGTSDVYYGGSHERQEKIVTVTNRGSQTFVLQAEVDTSACKRTDASWAFYTNEYEQEVKPGESCEVKVRSGGSRMTPGTVEGCKLRLTAYYPDTKEKNTLTKEIPLSAKFLFSGGYEIKNEGDITYGTVKTSDGVDRGPYSGNSRFTAYEGSSVTFVMTPYHPGDYCVTDIKLNGKSVGTSGMVNNTYTISDIHDNYVFEAVFGPITDPSQKPVGSMTPASWAADAVARAMEYGILPAELQSSYDQPITRKEFCALADWCYLKVCYTFPDGKAEAFTDCDDFHVRAMATAGVVGGTGDGTFNPDGQITREQAATILTRLAEAMGKPLPAETPTFADSDSVAAWAKAGVGAMQASGVMNGTGNNTFSPGVLYSREQSVVTIMRLYDMMKK